MKMTTIQLIKFSLCIYGLKVSDLFWRSIFNFNFDLQVEFYMTLSSLKLKMNIDSDEKFKTISQFL